jgi:hypothetical protein
MRLFSKNTNGRFGAIIDIGSGSVLVAIIHSVPGQTYPEVIWSKREYTPLRKSESINNSAKSVMTSLLNAMMLLNSEGRAAMREVTGHNKLPDTQVTVAAPWSYTVTKNIFYSNEKPFTISHALVDELLRTAHSKVEEELKENEEMTKLGLSVITRTIIGLLGNGYAINLTGNQKASSLQIVESSAVVQDYLITAVNEAQEKVLPDTELKLYSFILVYYFVLRNLYPDIAEYCIIDITYEATEIGIVRDGVLCYSTHAPFGAFSIAREIEKAIDVPLEEAFGYLKNADPIEALTSLSDTKKQAIRDIFSTYQDKLTDLFHETGDSLAIPKKLFLHGNLESEAFFSKYVASAAKSATSSSHAVYPITAEILTKNYSSQAKTDLQNNQNDTALLISAQFFHTSEHQDKFEHL